MAKKRGKALNLSDSEIKAFSDVSRSDTVLGVVFWKTNVPTWAQDLISARQEKTPLEENQNGTS